jgi:hypothetical protein
MYEHYYKHYAQKNENNIVIHFFSDAFQSPDENSIFIEESNNRHCNKQASDEYGYIYKIENGKYIKRTDDDRKDEYKQHKINIIKQTAHRIIINKYPAWKQRNMAQRGVELVDLKTERELTVEEEAERQALKDIKAWVDSIRSQSNAMESDLENLTGKEIKNYEVNYNQ